MERRRLGRTGHHSSVAILGGAAFSDCTPEQAAKTFDAALKAGVNHVDVAPTYGDAELLLGALLPDVRDRVFVAGKTLRRNPDGVKAQLAESLDRLQIEHFDLYQLHGVTSLADLDERADAYAAVAQAREAGLAKAIGVTGHGLDAPAAHLEALRRWDLDTVMFALNPRLWSDADYRADVTALLKECRLRNVGVQIIKVIARGPWGADARTADTWYRPHTDPDRIKAAVDFVLSLGGVQCVVTPADRMLVAPVLDAAQRPAFLSERRRRTIVADFADDTPIFPADDEVGGPGETS